MVNHWDEEATDWGATDDLMRMVYTHNEVADTGSSRPLPFKRWSFVDAPITANDPETQYAQFHRCTKITICDETMCVNKVEIHHGCSDFDALTLYRQTDYSDNELRITVSELDK